MNELLPKPVTTYLLLGTNLGDQAIILSRARIFLTLYVGKIYDVSKLYETAPWGETDQSNFLNQAIKIDTLLSSEDLMKEIIKIEEILGKKKVSKWGPRTIDIDILLYGSSIINQVNIEIPHPRMLSWNFVLIPLSEIAGEVIHPVAKKKIKELLGMCTDNGSVALFKENSI